MAKVRKVTVATDDLTDRFRGVYKPNANPSPSPGIKMPDVMGTIKGIGRAIARSDSAAGARNLQKFRQQQAADSTKRANLAKTTSLPADSTKNPPKAAKVASDTSRVVKRPKSPTGRRPSTVFERY